MFLLVAPPITGNGPIEIINPPSVLFDPDRIDAAITRKTPKNMNKKPTSKSFSCIFHTTLKEF